jgi:tRNA nucleotidyltransferase/poly(A) polymerase
MNSFTKWMEDRRSLAKAYKDMMGGVPQDQTHHPEGDVLAHSKLVRKAARSPELNFSEKMPSAISELQQAQTNPNNPLYNVLSDIDFQVSKVEEKILAMAAWLHDIGKGPTTTQGGEPWQNPGVSGKIQSIGHQDPKHFMPQIEKLGEADPPPETKEFYLTHQDLINWLIEHHMDLSAGQFSRTFIDQNFNNGKVADTQQMKLLLILMWADKMGRDPEVTVANLAKMSDKVLQSSQRSVTRTRNMANQSKPFEGSPADFAALLKSNGLSGEFLARNLRNKFPGIGDQEIAQLTAEGFAQYMEAAQPTTLEAQIPIPPECIKIAQALVQQGAEVYAVGGAVRDFLSGKKPKDVDLTTNLSDKEIIRRCQEAGFEIMEKKSAKSDDDKKPEEPKEQEPQKLKTFGVIFVHTHSGEEEPTEVAPFRSDIGVADGRRPDEVQFGVGIAQDALRRDFTINNLYYDFGFGKYGQNIILDFNPHGQGIQDVQNGVVRAVGDPMQRFVEDRFRILRMLRFDGRLHAGDITQSVDQRTLEAVRELGDIRSPYQGQGVQLDPISGERIQGEFVKGLMQSQSTKEYLNNYVRLNLMDQVFPGMNVDENGIDRLGNSKNPKVVLAWLLRGNPNVAEQLNNLNWPNEISAMVKFLISILKFNPEQVVQFINGQKQHNAKAGGPQQMSADVLEFAQVAGRHDLMSALTYLVGQGDWEKEVDPDTGEENWVGQWNTEPYVPPKINAAELPEIKNKKIPPGPAWGTAVDDEKQRLFSQSWKQFLDRKRGFVQQPDSV